MTDKQILDCAGIFIERHEGGLFGVGESRSIFSSRRYFKTHASALSYALDKAFGAID